MAALTTVTNLYSDGGGSQRACLLRISGVNSGDTIDLNIVGPFAYKKVEAAVFFGADQRNGVVAGAAGNGTNGFPTQLTLLSIGMGNDVVNLLVIGVI
jgi:hypothetical protein